MGVKWKSTVTRAYSSWNFISNLTSYYTLFKFCVIRTEVNIIGEVSEFKDNKNGNYCDTCDFSSTQINS